MWATHGLPFRPLVYRGCPAWTHPCASESRMTLRQRANPLSCWLESRGSVMVVFVVVVVHLAHVQLRILTESCDEDDEEVGVGVVQELVDKLGTTNGT